MYGIYHTYGVLIHKYGICMVYGISLDIPCRQTTSLNEFLSRGRHSASGKMDIPCISFIVDIACISKDIHGISTKYIHDISRDIHGISFMYIHGISLDILGYSKLPET